MPVKSIEVTSIEARRFSTRTEAMPPQVRIDHNSTVTLVQKLSDNESSVDFRYTATFGNLGLIKLEGKAILQGSADTLQSTWETTRQMPQEIASEIHTAVMRVCVPEAVFLARDLQLPPPIPLPQIQFQKPPAAAGHGPEVQ